jgi:hypothetical protein
LIQGNTEDWRDRLVFYVLLPEILRSAAEVRVSAAEVLHSVAEILCSAAEVRVAAVVSISPGY